MTSKTKLYQIRQLKNTTDILFKLEKRKYTTDVLRFITRHGINRNYNVRLFKALVEEPELYTYLERYDIRNHRDLHKYIQQRLIEYVNQKLVTGK